MLVKLGEVWVDPSQVVFITAQSYAVSIAMKEGYIGSVSIFTAESREMAVAFRDDFAAVVNNALSTQSYGGESEESAESK